MYIYNASQINQLNVEKTSVAKYVVGTLVAAAIIYGPMAVLWLH